MKIATNFILVSVYQIVVGKYMPHQEFYITNMWTNRNVKVNISK